MDNSKQLKLGSILSYGQMILSVVISLIYHPFMIRLLGKSEYGLYSTVASFISLLSILNLGFNAGYVRYYAQYKKRGETENIYKLNGLFLIIFAIIGVVSLICSLVVTFNLHWVFDQGLTAQEYETGKILMLLLGVNMALSFPMSVFTTIISANEKFVFLKLLGMIRTVVSPLVTVPLLLLGFKSIAIVSVTLALSVLTDVCYFIYVKKALKNKFIFRNFEKGIFRSLFVYTGFIAINLIVDQVNWNIGKFLLGRFKGTEVVAVYAVGYSLYQYYMMMSTSISGVFTPRVHNLITATRNNPTEQKKALTTLFIKVGRIQFLILGLVGTGLIFFGKPFIHYWAGEGYEEGYYVTLLLSFPATIPLIQNLGLEIQRAQNKHKFRSYIYLGMAMLNLVSTVFLCQKYGATGAAIGTAVSLVIANGLVMNIYYHKACNLDILAFWRSILRMSLGLILPIVCGVLIMRFIDLYSLLYLFLFIGIYTVIYCISMWFLGMNKYERGLVLKPAQKLLKMLGKLFGKLFHKKNK